MTRTKPRSEVQFERLGDFISDSRDAQPGKLVFHRSVTLKDAWAKSQKKS